MFVFNEIFFNHIFFENKTRKTLLCLCIYTMNSFFWIFWIKKVLFLFCIFKICIFNNIAIFRKFVCKFKISTKFWTMMFSLNYVCFVRVCFVNNYVITNHIYYVSYNEKKSWNSVACEIHYDYHFEMRNSCFIFWLFVMKFI